MTLAEIAYDIRSYNFSFVKGSGVSGNLAASGAGKVLTFTRIPFGLAVGQVVRLSGGTGTAEQVAITAMGTAGLAGTVTITTSQTHTGLWAVSSATAGIQEADTSIDPINGIAAILIPSGDHTIYAAAKIHNAAMIFGLGKTSSQIIIASATGGAIDVIRDKGVTFADFGITYGGTQSSGGYGIRLNGLGVLGNNFYSVFTRLYFYGTYDCVLNQTAYAAEFTDVKFANFSNTGITFDDALATDAGGGTAVACSFDGAAGSPCGISVLSTGAIRVIGCGFGGSQWALIKSNPVSSGLVFSDNDVENTTLGGVRISSTFDRVVISNNLFSQYGAVGSWYGVFFGQCPAAVVSGNHFITVGTNNIGIYVGVASTGICVGENYFRGFLYAVQSDGECSVGHQHIQDVYGAGREIALSAASLASLVCPMVFAGIGAWKDGSVMVVTDGKVTSGADNTLTNGGTGALAVRINGVWRAFATQN